MRVRGARRIGRRRRWLDRMSYERRGGECVLLHRSCASSSERSKSTRRAHEHDAMIWQPRKHPRARNRMKTLGIRGHMPRSGCLVLYHRACACRQHPRAKNPMKTSPSRLSRLSQHALVMLEKTRRIAREMSDPSSVE